MPGFTKGMEKIISYPISVVYYFFFGLCLLVFHPIQWLCLKFGYNAHKKSVDVLNLFLISCTRLIGTRYTVIGREKLPVGVPVIIVANHQSLYDVIAIIWFLRKIHPKFVSKQELGKGIPSVSFNLRHGGSVLIDRKDPRQALPVIKQMGEYIEQNNRSAVIFPEGTRSKTGQPKEFAQTGLKIMMKAAPSAYVLPLTINNSWKMAKFGYFPLGLGNHLKFTVHEPIAISGLSFEEIIEYTEKAVTGAIKY